MAAKKNGETPQEPAALPEPKRCFFIAPIGAAGSETRRRSDQVFKHILTPICGELGYHLIRADRIAEAGMITTQVVEHLIHDELVVADLTGRNPNVFYELAIRHVTRKPLIQLMGADEELPFDVAAMRTVFVDIRDLDSVAAAKDEIADQVRSFETGKLQMTTPISHALDWEKLRSGNPEERALAELTATVSQLASEIRGMRRGTDDALASVYQRAAFEHREQTELNEPIAPIARAIASIAGCSVGIAAQLVSEYPGQWSPTEKEDMSRVIMWGARQCGMQLP
jgi:hypothetical protein